MGRSDSAATGGGAANPERGRREVATPEVRAERKWRREIGILGVERKRSLLESHGGGGH